MDILAVLFIIVLLVPAFILIARMKRELGGHHGEKEWMRVQQQRNAVMRRRNDERREKVWSAIDSAHHKFREREELDVGGTPIPTAPQDPHSLAALPNKTGESTRP